MTVTRPFYVTVISALLLGAVAGNLPAQLSGGPVTVLQNFDTADTECAAVHPGGRWVVTGHEDGTLQLRETDTGYLLYRVPFSGSRIRQIRFDRSGNRFAASDGTVLRVYDFSTLTPLTDFGKGGTELHWFEFLPDGNRLLVSSGTDGTLTSLKPDGSGIPEGQPLSPSPLKRFRLSADGSKIAVQTGDERILFYGYPGFKPLFPEMPLNGDDTTPGPWQVDFEKGRILLTFNGFGSGHAEWRDLKTGKVLARSEDFELGYYGYITDCFVESDGKRVIISGSGGSHGSFLLWINGKVIVWDGKTVTERDSFNSGIRGLAVVPGNGRIIVCGGRATPSGAPLEYQKISCWDLNHMPAPVNGPQDTDSPDKPVWQVNNPATNSIFVRFAPVPQHGDGNLILILSGSAEWLGRQTLRVWDAEKKVLLAEKSFWGLDRVIPDYKYGSILLIEDQGNPEGDPFYHLVILDPLTLSARDEREFPWKLESDSPYEWFLSDYSQSLIEGKPIPPTRTGLSDLFTTAREKLWEAALPVKGVIRGEMSADSRGGILWGKSRLLFLGGKDPENSLSRWILIDPEGKITLSDPSLASEFRITEGMTSRPWKP